MKTTLAVILGMTDAVWRPMRAADWTGRASGALYEARTAFPVSGVPLAVGGGAVRRKAGERELGRLADAGLVTLHGQERRQSVRLTERGDTTARALCGVPNLDAAGAMLRRVVALAVETEHGTLCRELWLAGLKNYSDDGYQESLAGVEQHLLPALCRGWVVARSDIHGRVYYTPTALGCEIADSPQPELPDGLPEPDEDAQAVYFRTLVDARRRLRTMTPSNPSEIGECPLPASIDIPASLPAERATP